jgi:hypothetical protein
MFRGNVENAVAVADEMLTLEAAAEAWVRTADALLCGLNHALSNRISSLLVVSPERVERGLGAAEAARVGAELTKLEELLRLYRLLERSDLASAEPVRVPDAVADALALFSRHPALRDIECTVAGDADLPAVLLNPSVLVHAMAFLVCAVAARLDSNESGALHVAYTGDLAWVTIAVETRSPIAEAETAGAPALDVVRWLLRGAPVTAAESRAPGGGLRLEFRLPTLASQRRQERGH